MTEKQKSDRLLKAIQLIAISPEDAKKTVADFMKQAKQAYPDETDHQHQDRVAQKIVSRYARWSALGGGATALVGVVPGLGTVVASLGGALGDAALTMKLQVDMVMCLTETYGYDLNSEDARLLSLLIAGGGTLEKAGVEFGTRLASKAGVRLLRQYLKGAALQTTKQVFKKVGLVFTRKALEKAIPFGIGVVLGSTANYLLTRYVGRQALDWFRLDRENGGPAATMGST